MRRQTLPATFCARLLFDFQRANEDGKSGHLPSQLQFSLVLVLQTQVRSSVEADSVDKKLDGQVIEDILDAEEESLSEDSLEDVSLHALRERTAMVCRSVRGTFSFR